MTDEDVTHYFDDPSLDLTHWLIWSKPLVGDEPVAETATIRLGALLAAHSNPSRWRDVAEQWVPGLTRIFHRNGDPTPNRTASTVALRSIVYASDVAETDGAVALATRRKPGDERPQPAPNGNGTKATPAEYVRDATRRVVEVAEGKSPMCVPTPFGKLNWMLAGGFYPGDLVYLGGRPSTGKTALVLQFLATAAAASIPSLCISAEMDNTAIARRILSQVGGLDATALRMAQDVDHAALARTVARVWDWPLWMTDKTRTTDGIRSVLTQVPQRIQFLVVDYLQLLHIGQRGVRDRRQEIEAISAALKAIALEWSMPVVVLSGLTRPARSVTKTAPPSMADLRESGALEHDADVILLLAKAAPDLGDVTLSIAKNREGRTGELQLHFDAPSVRFGVMEEHDEDE
jgi:hypothetical protein